MNSAVKLSILIPTILRPSVLRTAINCSAFVGSHDFELEVIVSVNPINLGSSEAQEVLHKLKAIDSVRVEIQDKPQNTAEESAFHSVSLAKGEWVWFLGDDDEIFPHSFKDISPLLDTPVDFWLLNCSLQFGPRLGVPYYRVGPNPVQIDSGLRVFSKFGLVSAMTTLSCLLVRKTVFDMNLFEAIANVQPIYAHSFFLFCKTYKSQVGVADQIFVSRKESSAQDVQLSLESYARSAGVPPHSVFTFGLWQLICFAAQITGIPIKHILNFRELEVYKSVDDLSAGKFKVYVTQLGSFIQRFLSEVDDFELNVSRLETELSAQGFKGNQSDLVFPAPVRVTI